MTRARKSSRNSEPGATPVTKQVVAHAGAGDVEEVALGVVDVLEVGGVGDGLDAGLERDDLVVAGGDDDGAELEALGEVHRADGGVAGLAFGTAVELAGGEAGGLHRSSGALQLGLRPHEDADLLRRHALTDPRLHPLRDGHRLLLDRVEDGDGRLGAVEGGDGAAAHVRVAVHVAHLRREQPVGLAANLVRGAVVDAQRA